MKVLCEKCGFLLYVGVDVKAPYDIVLEHDGRCPNCAKRLRHTPRNIEITPLVRVVERA